MPSCPTRAMSCCPACTCVPSSMRGYSTRRCWRRSKALARDPRGNASALVVNAQGVVESRSVQASRSIGDNWLIDNGLVAGDRVIIEGLQKVQPGMSVNAVEVPSNGPRRAMRTQPTGRVGVAMRPRPTPRRQPSPKTPTAPSGTGESLMLSRFFIDRPIFAWVVALIIMLTGGLAITRLPVARYPNIAPPTIAIAASYPGASAKTVEDSVTQIIEQNMTVLDGLLYMASSSDNAGNVSITLTFASGTNPDIAQVQVQNKLRKRCRCCRRLCNNRASRKPRTPAISCWSSGFASDGWKHERRRYRRLAGHERGRPHRPRAGRGRDPAFRLASTPCASGSSPDKLKGYGLTPERCDRAIQAQNAQIPRASWATSRRCPGQHLNATIIGAKPIA